MALAADKLVESSLLFASQTSDETPPRTHARLLSGCYSDGMKEGMIMIKAFDVDTIYARSKKKRKQGHMTKSDMALIQDEK